MLSFIENNYLVLKKRVCVSMCCFTVAYPYPTHKGSVPATISFLSAIHRICAEKISTYLRVYTILYNRAHKTGEDHGNRAQFRCFFLPCLNILETVQNQKRFKLCYLVLRSQFKICSLSLPSLCC